MANCKTSFPTNPCVNFYDWYKHIHGRCPVDIRERFDRNGFPRTPESDERDFQRLIRKLKKSLVK